MSFRAGILLYHYNLSFSTFPYNFIILFTYFCYNKNIAHVCVNYSREVNTWYLVSIKINSRHLHSNNYTFRKFTGTTLEDFENTCDN